MLFRSGPKLLAVVMLLSAMFAALIMNDATVLLLTPVVIRCCVSSNADPLPYLMGTMMGANIGSLSSAVGNPKNAFIVSQSGIRLLISRFTNCLLRCFLFSPFI